MKKQLLLPFLLFAFLFQAPAQKPDTVKQYIQHIDQGRLAGALSLVPDLEVYEYPKFKGRKTQLKWEGGKLVAPFKLISVSFRVSPGRIVYIRKCIDEFPEERAYTGEVAAADLTRVCAIRSDAAVTLPVQFNGISTIIHNNDCRRVFGDVKVKVYESSPDGAAQALMPCSAAAPFRGDAFTFQAFTHPSSHTRPTYTQLLHDANPVVPVVTTVTGASYGGAAVANFVVGASALRDGRAGLIITSLVGSAHKTCDLCDDFSSNVHMDAPVTKAYPINRADTEGRVLSTTNNRVVMGPLKAKGSRDGSAITASGGTFLDFYTHFTVLGL